MPRRFDTSSRAPADTVGSHLQAVAEQSGNGRLLATLLLMVGIVWVGLSVLGFLGVGVYAGRAHWGAVLTMMSFVASLSLVPFAAALLCVLIPAVASVFAEPAPHVLNSPCNNQAPPSDQPQPGQSRNVRSTLARDHIDQHNRRS